MAERGFSPTRQEGGVWSLSAQLGPPAPTQPDLFPVFPLVRQGRQLLAHDPVAAETRAREWLADHPADSDATYFLGAALRRQERAAEASKLFATLTASQPQMSQAWRELGIARAQLGEKRAAHEALYRAVDLDWFDAEAWLALGEQAELPDAAARSCFQSVARHFAHGDYAAALPQVEQLVSCDSANLFVRMLRGLALAWSRKFDEGVQELAQVTREHTCGPGVWLEYGRLLRATSDDRAANAFATAIALLPSFSSAYVGLANSKSIRIDDDLVGRIRMQLEQTGLPANDRARFNYVLGKSLEDLGRYADSFAAYHASNEILKRVRGSGVEHSNLYLRDAKAFFTKEFFITRGSAGADTESPIFIVGMPRSGSTLVEQILSSHPEVEALGEIANLTETGQRLAPGRPGDPHGGYPWVLQYLDCAGFRRMGEEYVRSTQSRRRTEKPFFTDKLPGNYCHVGMIQLALPNARIIDVRRHPLDCCLSCYKHYFPVGHLHALDLADIGRFYANYVALMAHFDEVLPGRVYRLIYEELIADPEREVRRMLDHIGLDFDEACLKFYENRRPVLTFSADQVRQPLFASGIGRWRSYDAYLEPLRRELGDIVEAYPAVPVTRPAAPRPEEDAAGPPVSFVTGLRRVSFETASRFTGATAPDEP